MVPIFLFLKSLFLSVGEHNSSLEETIFLCFLDFQVNTFGGASLLASQHQINIGVIQDICDISNRADKTLLRDTKPCCCHLIGGHFTGKSLALLKAVRSHSLFGACCCSSCSVWLQVVCCLDQETLSCRVMQLQCQVVDFTRSAANSCNCPECGTFE
jgi:hypothetical protein